MPERPGNILFLCTGNSARSILAEALVDHWGKGAFKGYSAGSFPKGTVNPLALKLLRDFAMPTGHLRSKSWDEFARPSAPSMDYIFTGLRPGGRRDVPSLARPARYGALGYP
jgi:protein-tyrosine-phosphatase